MILYRSLSKALVEILLKSSSGGPCIKILTMLCTALHWCLYESSAGTLIGISCMVRSSSRSVFDDLLNFFVVV